MAPNTFIPYPNVPAYPGVPLLVRPAQELIAANPVIAIGIGSIENILATAFQSAPQWGIFDTLGNQLGVPAAGQTSALQAIGNSLLSQVTGKATPVLSTVGFEFLKEMKVSDFPVERGGFASYNKVEMPGTATVALGFAGSASDRTTFLQAFDAATKSTNVYTVLTPEISYSGYTIERYTVARRAYQGATLILLNVSLKEIRTVTAAYTTATVSPVVAPSSASAAAQTNSGMTQPAAPDISTALSLYNKIPSLLGIQ